MTVFSFALAGTARAAMVKAPTAMADIKTERLVIGVLQVDERSADYLPDHRSSSGVKVDRLCGAVVQVREADISVSSLVEFRFHRRTQTGLSEWEWKLADGLFL
jgi:hypothetical protein